jgi:putative transcriptional regulator
LSGLDISFNNNLEPKKGRVLISEPFLEDPYFKRTTVLIVEHNEEGTIGFILNKELEVSLNDAIKGFPTFEGSLCFGGPVCKDQLFYLHTLGDQIGGSLEIGNGLFWGGDFDTVKDLILDEKITSTQIRFFIGYSGWNPGQLADEIAHKSWIVCESKPELIMKKDSSELWSDLLRSLGKHYSIMANFPEDPSLN